MGAVPPDVFPPANDRPVFTAAESYIITEFQGLRRSVERLILVVDGDQNSDVKGIRARLVNVEAGLQGLIDERRISAEATGRIIRWFKIGFAAFTVISAGMLLAIVRILFQ